MKKALMPDIAFFSNSWNYLYLSIFVYRVIEDCFLKLTEFMLNPSFPPQLDAVEGDCPCFSLLLADRPAA